MNVDPFLRRMLACAGGAEDDAGDAGIAEDAGIHPADVEAWLDPPVELLFCCLDDRLHDGFLRIEHNGVPADDSLPAAPEPRVRSLGRLEQVRKLGVSIADGLARDEAALDGQAALRRIARIGDATADLRSVNAAATPCLGSAARQRPVELSDPRQDRAEERDRVHTMIGVAAWSLNAIAQDVVPGEPAVRGDDLEVARL